MTRLAAVLTTRLSGLRHEKGATAVEYSLMVGLIALVIIAAVRTLGTNVGAIFDDANTKIYTP